MIGRAGGKYEENTCSRQTAEDAGVLNMQNSHPRKTSPFSLCLPNESYLHIGFHWVIHCLTNLFTNMYTFLCVFCDVITQRKCFIFERREEWGTDFGGNMKTYMEQEFETSV